MTAKWETYLKKIGKREGNQENFITNIKKFIVHLLEAVPNDIEKLNFSDYQEQKEKEAEKSIDQNYYCFCPFGFATLSSGRWLSSNGTLHDSISGDRL